MTKNGENTAIADLDMGGNKLKNGKTATLVGDFPIVSDIQNSVQTFITSTGSANAYVITLAPAPAAYITGQKFTFKANFANTGAATVNVNSLGAKTIKKDSDTTDLVTNDIVVGQIVTITYDGTVFQSDVAVTTLLDDLTPQLGGFLDPNSNYIGWDKGGDIASASPLVVDTDGNMLDVTGTTGFSVMTVAANRKFTLQFDGILTITDGASIILPGGANFTTAAGDVLECQSIATDTVLVTNIAKADGTAIVSGKAGWTPLLALTASASTEFDFINGTAGMVFDGTFKLYAFVFTRITVSGNNEAMLLRTGNGSIDTGSNYSWNAEDTTASNAAQGGTSAQLNETGIGNAADETFSGTLYVVDPAGTGDTLTWWMDGVLINGVTVPQRFQSSGMYETTGAVDRMRFFPGSGNMPTGTCEAFGIG